MLYPFSGLRLDPVATDPAAAGGALVPKVEAKANPVAPAEPKVETPTGGGMIDAKEVARLQAVNEASTVLLRTDTKPEVREEAMRFLMSQNNYTSEQIEEYMARAKGTPASDPANPEQLTPEQAALVDTQTQVKQVRVTQLRGMMDSALNSQFDSTTPVGVLLGELKKYQGEKFDEKKLRPVLTEKIRRETLDRLKIRRAQGRGDFQDGWIAEEAKAAAEAVAQEYRTVIGDVSLIGQSPETVSGEDEFLKSAPVAAPAYKAGTPTGDTQTQAHSYTVDALSRLALAGGKGGTRA